MTQFHRQPNATIVYNRSINSISSLVSPITGNQLEAVLRDSGEYNLEEENVSNQLTRLKVSIEPQNLVNFRVPEIGKDTQGIEVTGRWIEEPIARFIYNQTYPLEWYDTEILARYPFLNDSQTTISIFVMRPSPSRLRLDRIFGTPFQGIIYNIV